MRTATSRPAAGQLPQERSETGLLRVVAAIRRHPLPLVVGFLLVLTIGFFNPVFAGGHFSTIPAHERVVFPWAGLPSTGLTEYPQSDQADLSHPWNSFLTRTLDDGTVPFWDPNSYAGGYPFFANGSSAILYPPRLVTALLFDPVRAHDAFIMLHVFLSGLLMYALMREFRVGRAGSILAAVSWMFAGFNMAWLHLEVTTPMSVFVPLDLLCVHRAFRTRSWTFTILAGLALGATLTSGHLLMLGGVYMVAVAYAAALAIAGCYRAARARAWPEGLSHACRFITTMAISACSGMLVLLPTAHALRDSQRDPYTYKELVQSFLAPARTLLYGFVPPPLPVTADRMHEMAFAGTATGVLALLGFFVRRRSGSWLGRGLLVAAFATAIRTPLTWIAYHVIPGFNVFRPYSRLLAFSAFAIAVLAGFGLDALWRHTGEPADGVTGPRRAFRIPGGRPAVVALSVLAIGATTVQLGRYGRDLNPPYVPRHVDAYFQRTPLIQALDRELNPTGGWPGRVLPTRVTELGAIPGPPTLFAAESVVFGFDSAGGYDSAVPRRVTALVRALQGEDLDTVLSRGLPSAYAPTFDSPAVRFDLLTRLGITVLATNPVTPLETTPTPGGPLPPLEVAYDGPDGRLLRVTGASASPHLVYAEEVVRTPAEAFRRFLDPAFDFKGSVVLEAEDLRRAGLPSRLRANGSGQVLSARRGVNSAHVTVTTSSPAWLVFQDSWAEGWSAEVDGVPAKVVRANYAKRAVLVPAGRSEVELRYRPPGLTAGAIVTLLTLLGCGAALVSLRRGVQPRIRLPRRRARR